MSRCDNQYFSSVRMPAASSNTLGRFNMREPQGNNITTTDSLYHRMISSFVFMLTSFGFRAYSRPVTLERSNSSGRKKKNTIQSLGEEKTAYGWLNMNTTL